ncbi:Ni,Fe-hydrogenase I cytochrome b subunit [Mucilaginibacter frigoritolerans]|jgi:Ni/Fe-hydrogenase 1 B-type cytochrome subunit|uniref:Ni,Fe-hydrogenase I cytochrome b subunit n=1 Tax=Mucilaginibacter frigoritolerans TaxID=652788 RepID=A0A562TMK3_9SPHI|nr:cytochrome b/b6 domain-containing protein [Mucilaginibacter frigoritolerans]TWI94777.1 Ni,Fe-hydrogenase I cytochrome b subunit [Mucilaginibacter frigoritolerans]
MEHQETAAITSADITRTKKYSPSIRLWHWSNAVIITGSLLTVLVNSTVLKPWANARLISDKLKEKGINVSDDQTRSAAFVLSDKVWAIHTYLGYVLVALLVFRIVIELFGLADKTLIGKIKAAKRSFLSTKENRIANRNEMLIKMLYILFYILLILMAITGLALAFSDNIPALKQMHFIREVHEFTMYLVLGFIIIHIVGICIGERKRHKGIVSDMINGGWV